MSDSLTDKPAIATGTSKGIGLARSRSGTGPFGTKLTGAFYCSCEALHRFRSGRGGSVINISRLAGKDPFASGAVYSASKLGLNGFTEAMMMDHRHDNVQVSYIMPGSVDTAFGGESGEARSDWKIAPEDIAQIVLRLPASILIGRVEVRPSQCKITNQKSTIRKQYFRLVILRGPSPEEECRKQPAGIWHKVCSMSSRKRDQDI